MQTNFSSEQLADPHVKEADDILRRCVHCGLCIAVCPTYVLLGDERDSPRGRIYMIKDMLEGGGKVGPELKTHIDRCLSCLSCMTTCPSGVDYMHLVDLARGRVEKTGNRTLKERFVRSLLAHTLPYPERFRLALQLAPLGRPWVKLLRRLGLKELAAMIELAPPVLPPSPRFDGPGTAATDEERRARVILLTGCAQQVLRPGINDSTIRLLARRGVDVVVSAGSGCCGALTFHLGQEAAALAHVKRNVDAWSKELAKGPVDAIIANASGCGTMVKDYGHLLKRDPEYAARAQRVSELARDICEFVGSNYDLGPPKRWSSLRVAYHPSCSLQHGQGVVEEPRALLVKAGFGVVDIPEAHICCGSAGTYNILQPDLANALRERKTANIKRVKSDVVATGNIGCIAQLAGRLDEPVVHTVELLDWAYGGPVPAGLEPLARFMTNVPEPRRRVDDFIHA
jgi:glycolate dehydrogenase iron-sulfur subunit